MIAFVLFDIFLIVTLARTLGNLLARIGQPRVVGEILSGMLLGPTLLGQNLSQVIAPLEVRAILNAIATLALILFMFIAGAEYEISRVKGRGRQAVILALLSVAVPALFGFLIANRIHSTVFAGPQGTSLLPFALFVGAALSVTSFPVMAHILMERGELNTPIGALGIATAGVMSVFMFTYIAFTEALVGGNGFDRLLIKTILILIFGIISWSLVRPVLGRVLPAKVIGGEMTGDGLAIVLGGMLLYGLITGLMGINGLVGGFAWGIILPATPAIRQAAVAKVREITLIFLLPVFFAIAGFSTDLKLITVQNLPIVVLLLLAAIVGKFIAVLPARAFGLNWAETAVLGTLFNTRGLLVLAVGLIGLQLEIITNLTFTILVVVALATNLMTLPLLNLFTGRARELSGEQRSTLPEIG